MPLHPRVYGALLEKRLAASGARTWLINTGWTGGPYGVGRRIDIASTRRLVDAALSGELETVPMRTDPVFGLAVPTAVSGVDTRLLDPRAGWADPDAYDRQAKDLLARFAENYQELMATAAASGADISRPAAE
jgi:phosphoenolpyruvate carboxykinase (ATP)